MFSETGKNLVPEGLAAKVSVLRFRISSAVCMLLLLTSASSLVAGSVMAVLFDDHTVHCFVEKEAHFNVTNKKLTHEMETVFNKQNIDHVSIYFQNRLPRDPRHNSKIDYKLLKEDIK